MNSLIFGCIVLVLNLLSYRRIKKVEDFEVLTFAKEVQRNYNGNMLKALKSSSKNSHIFNKAIGSLILRSRFGDFSFDLQDYNIRNRNLGELFDLILLGLQRGRNMARELELFITRSEKQIKNRNKITASVGGMESITYMGMIFFIPLFGGIMASVMSSSSNILNEDMSQTIRNFSIIIESYILIMLYLTKYFKELSRDFVGNIYSILPLALFGSLVIRLSSSYVSYIV